MLVSAIYVRKSGARDYYDLWKILNGYSDKLKMEIIPPLFIEKCKVRDVEFSNPEIFFNKAFKVIYLEIFVVSLE
jgi:predicted nucleotidyltransferase component of viral defense system